MSDWLPLDWEQFHFLRPVFLWGFVPVICFVVVGLLNLKQEVKWRNVIAPHLRPYVIQKGNHMVRFWMNLVLLLVFSFGLLALVGPTWKRVEVAGRDLETPMVILLDLSQSMLVDDLQPNRLERAKFKIKDLLGKNPQARAALVGYSGSAHTIVPLTRDYEIINNHVEGLKPSVMPFPGSDLAVGIAWSDSVMSVTDAPGTLILFSDDFERSHFELISKFFSQSEHKVEIVPMNTLAGGEVPNRWGNNPMMDDKGNPVYSALNQEALDYLSAIDGVTVHALTLDDSDVEAISEKIAANLKFTEEPEEKEEDWRDAGLLLVFPMAFLSLFWFRKGWVIYLLPIVWLSSCGQINDFDDLWYTPDYQGQQWSTKGDFKEAAEKYQDPLRKGVAYYKAGDFESAIKAFNEDTTAMGVYNLGLAYFNNGDTLAAQLAFAQAVEMDPTNAAAAENQNLVKQLIGGVNEIDPKEAQEASESGSAENEQNKDMEDLGGGGQEATKEDMDKKRKEETVSTDMRKGKELDQVPDDLGTDAPRSDQSKVLMRKVDDDPTLFLKRKFEYQVRKKQIKPNPDADKW